METRRETKAILLLALAACLYFSFVNPISINAQIKTLTIGLATPLSGRGADWGRMQSEGAKLAIEEINAKGGIRGIKFDLVIEDDKADPKEAANVAKKFTINKKILAVIGHLTSPTSFAAAPIYQRAGLPDIISLASNPDLPKQGDYIFQNTLVQTFESPAAANYAMSYLNAKKVAFIHINDDWGNSVKAIFPSEVKRLGGEIVAIEAYNPGEVDFRNLLIKIKNLSPDALYLAFHPAEAAQIVKQADELGIKFPIFLSGGAMTFSFIELAGKSGEGKVFISGFDPNDPDPIVKGFVDSFKRKYKENPTPYSSYVYDSVYLIAEAVKNIKGEITRKTLRDALAALKNVETTSGVLSANEFRFFGPRKTLAVIVKGGTYVYYKTIEMK